ncbi:D-alanyl-D-alanine carboxypeptidase [Halomonas vilamensis]|uniref:D-alanyl-D-alanine carboxypeptidase n=1 Tax=Vreelandella vilamensis TaxID=531309 RepID=A0ABU1H3T9_9GAMM|nr:D-alanyl-D-alanine carboxypeptidase [Halomonas vilamensis]MDR5898973.1 D-alanyl-D-alanine carboxypeptidase [Halomonas vilamensis]
MSSSVHANPRYAGIVVDLDNGEVLYAENADARRYPASLTKMMTLYLAFEALEEGTLRLDQALPVSRYAAAKPAVKLWLAAGSSIPVDTAIRALAVRSANDVAAVVAEALGGTEPRFAQMMTAKAREMGMHATTFRNASGLPDDAQVTTARDMLTLSVRVMQDFPQYYHYFGLQEFVYRGTKHKSHNRLVKNYPGADGLKTGFIRASGFNVATTATRGERRLVGVVMGGFSSQSRDTHMADLLNRSFMRAGLRDHHTWLADASFSRDFMRFGQPRVVEPVEPAPAARSLELLASLETSVNTVQDSRAEINAFESPITERNDPLRALIERESTLLGSRATQAWGIQVGAFSHADQAQQFARLAAERLPHAMNGRIAVDALDNSVFRARLMALQEGQARQACQQLKAQGMDCMVVNASL